MKRSTKYVWQGAALTIGTLILVRAVLIVAASRRIAS